MKSLNNAPIENSSLTVEQSNHLRAEGFKEGKHDSYFIKEVKDEYRIWEDRCLRKSIYTGDYDINIYILSDMIGVDIDYDCGGNYTNAFWKFSDYDNSFEKVYDLMVDYVTGYR